MGENLNRPRAYSVKRLSEEWGCSAKHIYNLIDGGKLRAFSIGKRGLRVPLEEVQRWESGNVPSLTGTEVSSSDDGMAAGLPTYAMKSLASV